MLTACCAFASSACAQLATSIPDSDGAWVDTLAWLPQIKKSKKAKD